MRRFIPPPIRAFDPSSSAGDPDAFGPVRNAAYEVGYDVGRREGHAAGLLEGEAGARADCNEEISRLSKMLEEQVACNSVADVLSQLLATRQADRRLIEQQSRSAVASAVEFLFPTIMAETAGSQIIALIDHALSERSPEELTVRACPATIEAVKSRGLPDAGATRVTLLPNATAPSGMADISWTGGGMTFDPAALLREVTEILSLKSARKDEI